MNFRNLATNNFHNNHKKNTITSLSIVFTSNNNLALNNDMNIFIYEEKSNH